MSLPVGEFVVGEFDSHYTVGKFVCRLIWRVGESYVDELTLHQASVVTLNPNLIFRGKKLWGLPQSAQPL